jgi:hypothetical protein
MLPILSPSSVGGWIHGIGKTTNTKHKQTLTTILLMIITTTHTIKIITKRTKKANISQFIVNQLKSGFTGSKVPVRGIDDVIAILATSSIL